MGWRWLAVPAGLVAAVAPAGVASADDREVYELTGFGTPSGNIGCYLDPQWVRCDVAERDWAPPPRPADCEFDDGQGISMDAGEKAEFVCAGDTALMAGAAVAYGDGITAGALRCEVAEAGVSCRDSESGHGFSLSRESYRLF